ncbi:hypothetical protein CAQU_05825 [Corynebacterium aquilae DSM 44791]|uniref:Metallo-beta-lactamase domain-containing protein n=1 Tax=Corynebacterium aquilae DSM 44791 TaxID=1431546 RepID=A0A1L7CFR3_9CORY|nr:hypothetical protein CAQU_05825 [Corynebacterium aquilae DSM 44791]
MDQISVSDYDNNCYLLVDHDRTLPNGTHPALLIDAADDAPALLQLAADNHATITDLLTTHQHFDHIRATEEILHKTGATHYVPGPDAAGIPGQHDEILSDGDTITFGHHSLGVRIVSGHTPGGAIVSTHLAGDSAAHIFVGDNIFPGGVGKTDNPDDFTSLLNGVIDAVFNSFSDDAVVHPGHGASTTVGTERPNLEQWRQRGW